MKIRYLVMGLILLSAAYAYAGGSSCATATTLVADGTTLSFDSIQPKSSNWYQFTAMAGRSYSIQVRDDVDGDIGSDFQVTYYGPNSTCPNPQAIAASAASVTDTHASEPVLPASASRSSIVTCPVAATPVAPCGASGGAGTYLILVQNSNATLSHYVNASVTETTLYALGWDTYGINTQFIFQNTTSQPIAYTFTLTPTLSGTQVIAPISGTLGAAFSSNSVTAPTTSGLNVSASQFGSAIFVHNGPPGAVQAMGWWFNYSTTPYTLMPIPIGPMRGK